MTFQQPTESIVYCEGYHDRAFLKGMLTFAGCTDPRSNVKSVRVKDAFGKVVTGGQFLFGRPSGRSVRVVPCGSDREIVPQAKLRLQQRSTNAVEQVVLCWDSDVLAGEVQGTTLEDRMGTLAREMDHRARRDESTGDFLIDDGSVRISLVAWWCADPQVEGVPAKQTLERLVVCALAAAYPERTLPVQSWLASRPSAPPAGPKEYSWSHMAGWYADQCCEAFLTCLWNDPKVARELQQRLEATGAWGKVQALSK